MYESFLKGKKKGPIPFTKSNSAACSSTQTGITDFQLSGSTIKYNRTHPRQKAITNAVMNMIIKDVVAAHIVEKEGFRDLINLLEPKYTMVSRQCLQYTHIPEKVERVKKLLIQQLSSINSCSITLDIWSSRRMHGYLGVTVHFVDNDWQMQSYLLSCKIIKGRHTGESICLEYENILEDYGIDAKVFKTVTDNASNMIKAFKVTFTELENVVSSGEHEEEEEQDECSDFENEVDGSEEIDDQLIEQVNISRADRMSCFAHTLQLTVKDGIDSSKQVTATLAKVSKLVHHIKKSTNAVEKLELKNEKQVVVKNDTRWNSQLKMVRRILELDLEDVDDNINISIVYHQNTHIP